MTDRTHARAQRAGRRHFRPLVIAIVLVAVFMAGEAAAAFWTGSLALLSDAGHMATDALGLAMALAAIFAADRAGRGGQRTFGLYRTEILAALANAALLFGVGVYVLLEAVRRLQDPPGILTGPMLLVAVAGLVVNVVAWRLLRPGASESINVRGAYLEVLGDLLGSIGVIAAAVVVRVTGWDYADPLIAAGIGLFILPRAWKLANGATRVLIQAAPADLDLDMVRSDLESIAGVIDAHDLHVWTLTTGMDVATVHVTVDDGLDPHPVLDRARVVLEDHHGIAHATLQVEPESHRVCAEATW